MHLTPGIPSPTFSSCDRFNLQAVAALVNATLTPAGGEAIPLDLQLDDAKQSLLAAFTPSGNVSSYSISISVDGHLLEGMPASFQVLPFTTEPANWHVASTAFTDGGGLQGISFCLLFDMKLPQGPCH